jgi:hypothetical protein
VRRTFVEVIEHGRDQLAGFGEELLVGQALERRHLREDLGRHGLVCCKRTGY